MEYDKLYYKNIGNIPLLELFIKKKGRILDCGCGSGDNARILQSQGWTVTGITISLKEQQVARDYCDKCYLHDLNNGIPKTVGSGYSVVLMSHILEHLVHPERLLEDAKNVLAPNGIIAVALPNVLVYYNRLRFMFGKFDYTSSGIMDYTHLRFYTFTSGKRLIEENGFKIMTEQGDGAFPLWKIRSILPTILVRKLNTLACTCFPDIFATQSLFLGVPSE